MTMKQSVLRWFYCQCFIFGGMAMFNPDFFVSAYDLKEPELMKTKEVTLCMWFFGAAMFSMGSLMAAAAQGSAATQRKAIQYGMLFPMFAMYGAWKQRELQQEGTHMLYVSMGQQGLNLLLAIVACYGGMDKDAGKKQD